MRTATMGRGGGLTPKLPSVRNATTDDIAAIARMEGIERDAHSFDDVVYAFDDLGTLIERIGAT
jgi:hypothetical protein